MIFEILSNLSNSMIFLSLLEQHFLISTVKHEGRFLSLLGKREFCVVPLVYAGVAWF